MSLAVVALNGILVALLLAALAFGWRLERRLKALKDSHDSFARAVADLDSAAARAEQGLADLRAATDEAADTLADRIAAAKDLAARLEKGVAQAERSRPAAAPAARAGRTGQAEDADLDLDLELDAAPPEARPAPAFVRPEPVTTPRSRARIDDDLFEPDPNAGRLRTILGGRR